MCVESGPDGAPPSSADRDAIASAVPIPAPAIVGRVSFPVRAVSSRALRLWPEADAPGLIRAILRHALVMRARPEIASGQTERAVFRSKPRQ